MKRKGLSGIQIFGILVALILVGGGFLYFSGNLQFLALSGFNVDSISTQPNIITEDTDLSKVKFIVSTSWDGSGHEIVGKVYDGELSDAAGDAEVDYGFTIRGEALEEDLIYKIRNQHDPLYEFKIGQYYCGKTPADVLKCNRWHRLDRCQEVLPSSQWWFPVRDGWDTYYLCVGVEEVAQKGRIDEPDIKFHGTIEVENDEGEIADATISSDQQAIELKTSSNKFVGTAKWTGSLVTGSGKPDEDGYVAVWVHDENMWRVAKEEKFTATIGKYDNVIDKLEYWSADPGMYGETISGDYHEAMNQIENQVNRNNIPVHTLTTADDKISFHRSSQIESPSKDGAGLKVNLDTQFTHPRITFYIVADWLGIKIPVGRPDIKSLNCNDFNSGEEGTIEAEIKNVGTGDARFSYSVDCDKLDEAGTPSKYRFDAGETKDIDIRIQDTSGKTEFTDRCKVKVYDVNKPSNYDEASVTCKVLKPKQCFTEGETRVIGKCIDICQDSTWTRVKCCKNLPVYNYETDEWECGDTTCIDVGNKKVGDKPCCDSLVEVEKDDGIYCEKPWDVPWAYIFAGLGGVLAFFLMAKNSIYQKDWIMVIVFLIVAAVIGIGVWWVVDNWKMIAASAGLLGILGAAGLYFFGGVFVTLASVLGAIIGAFTKGKTVGKIAGGG